jgi:RHS repeat-associated protein
MIQGGHNYDFTAYHRARYYDPSIGRFISEDPIGFSGGINGLGGQLPMRQAI